jgi:hypothetical protein
MPLWLGTNESKGWLPEANGNTISALSFSKILISSELNWMRSARVFSARGGVPTEDSVCVEFSILLLPRRAETAQTRANVTRGSGLQTQTFD